MSEPLKVGDVVKLKAGGPLMTVTAKLWRGRVRCLWFDPLNMGLHGWGALNRGEFAASELEPAA